MDYRAIEAARVVVKDVLGVRARERIVITSDSHDTAELASLLSSVIAEVGACPIEAWMPRLPYPGAPVPDAVAAIGQAADVWVELNDTYLLGTEVHHRAVEAGLRRFYSMSGMTIGDVIALELEVDRAALAALGQRLADLTSGCSKLEASCAHGTGFQASCLGRVAAPDTSTMPLGQTHVSPVSESVQGVMVFDGSAYPPECLGVLRSTVAVEFTNGRSRVASLGRESDVLRTWQAGLADPTINQLNHFSYGYHPRVPFPTGRLVTDERVFGAICVGFGPPQPYACHQDLTILDATVIADGITVQERGQYVDEEVRRLARILGAPGY